MQVAKRSAELIGKTDLLRLNSLSELTGCDIWVKLESQNPEIVNGLIV